MADEKEIVRSYKEIRQDYAYDPSIFNNGDDRVEAVKRIIQTRLNQVDRTIILLYADCQSYRKLGARLGVGKETARQLVLRIRDKILQEYNNGKDY